MFFVHIWARIQLDETTSHVFILFSKRKQFAFNAMLQPKLQIFVPEHKVRRGSRPEGPTQLWRYPRNKHATNLFLSNHLFLWGVLLQLALRWLNPPCFFSSHSFGLCVFKFGNSVVGLMITSEGGNHDWSTYPHLRTSLRNKCF